MRRARIGIIGAGWWAAANHIPALLQEPQAQIAGVCRLGRAELDRLCRHFDIAYGTEDYRQLLDEVALDGVIVASPHRLHFEHAAVALAHGLHVLVDKPMTTDAAEARALVALAAERDREIVVPYGWNFKSYAIEARRRLAQGAVGTIRHVSLHMASALPDLFSGQGLAEAADAFFQPAMETWASPDAAGGYAWGQLTHALGLLFRLTDLSPARVYAATGQGAAGVDVYDAAVLHFENGATATVSGAATAPKNSGFQLDLRVFGDDGMLLLDIERERLVVARHDGQDVRVPLAPGDGAYECSEPVKCFVRICLGAAAGNEGPGEVGLKAVEVIDALHRSARSGRAEKV
jgi:predicted dehydrogenase